MVVLGGGPAGLATAVSLRQAVPAPSVALITPMADEVPRVGESVPPAVEPLLRQLGVLERFLAQGHRPAFGTAAAWGGPHPLSNEFFFTPHQRGWQLDRACFERMLAETARDAGAATLSGRFTDASPDDAGGWRIAVRIGKDTRHLSAGFVVDATGRRALFAARSGVRAVAHDALIGAVRFFRDHATADPCGALVEACRDGWWYCAPLPGGGLVAAAMTEAAIARRRGLATAGGWDAALADAPYTRRRLAASPGGPEGEVRLMTARSQRLPRCTGHGWLAVGDAASAVDPLSSQGVVRALHFGLYAAYAIRDHLAGKPPGLAQYEALVQAEFKRYLALRAQTYGQERRWADAPFWATRTGHDMLDSNASDASVIAPSAQLRHDSERPLI